MLSGLCLQAAETIFHTGDDKVIGQGRVWDEQANSHGRTFLPIEDTMTQSQQRFHHPARAQLPLADELALEFPLAQQRVDPFGQASAPGFLLDVTCLLDEELLFDAVGSLLPLLVDLHPALRQLTGFDLLRVESLVTMRQHQFLDLLPVPHVEWRAILQRRRGAVPIAKRQGGWITIIAPQAQFLELLAHRYGRQPELLPQRRLVDPDIGKF